MELLNYMNLFVEVARTRNFRRAAETLGLSDSTLSRNITALEKKIGVRLLHRSTRKVELTEAGEVYFRRCQGIVEEAQIAHEALLGEALHPSGILRVSMPVDLAISYLVPVLGRFAAAYPLIDFELDVTPRRVDLLSEPFDLAIRMGPPPAAPSTLVARELAVLERCLYAAPGYLALAGTPAHPEDLARHSICIPHSAKGSLTLYRRDESINVALKPRYTLNSVGLSRAMAIAGQGIASLNDVVAAEDLARGALVRVLPGWTMAPVQVHAITETRLLPARTRLFIDYLKANWPVAYLA